jgi:hypothetical protein
MTKRADTVLDLDPERLPILVPDPSLNASMKEQKK